MMKKKYSKPVTDVFVMNCEGMMRECSWKASDQSSSIKIIDGQATDTEHNGWVHHEGGPDKVLGAKRSSLWD
mgnify:CR=1|jgi:hypothetical protein